MKAQVLQERPISGTYSERWYDARGDCAPVLFEDENGQEWVGVFGHGSIVKFSTAILYSTGSAAFVIAGGKGYIVDVNSGELKYRAGCDCLVGAIAVPKRDLIIACDCCNLYALTSTMQIWQSDFDAYDGIRLEQATPEYLSGQVRHHGGWYAFTLRCEDWEFMRGQPVSEYCISKSGANEETTTPDYIKAHKCSIHYRESILESKNCGCFYCLAIFPPSAITEWVDEVDEQGATALCPECGIDSVIGSVSGYPITRDFLKQMQEHWFGFVVPSFPFLVPSRPPSIPSRPPSHFPSLTRYIKKLAITSDGGTLLHTSSGQVAVWNIESRRLSTSMRKFDPILKG